MEKRLSMRVKRASTIRAVYGKTEDRYLDLVRRFPLRPLRTEADLDAAIAAMDALPDRPVLTAPEQDYLDVRTGRSRSASMAAMAASRSASDRKSTRLKLS